MVRHLAAEADMIPVDAPIARIEVAGAAAAVGGAEASGEGRRPLRRLRRRRSTPSPSNGGLRASPRARRLARDRGVDLAALIGSGRNGRISGDDVLARGHEGRRAASAIQVATIAGTIQVREWPAIGQRRGDAFLIHGLFADADSYTLLARRLAKGGLRVLAIDLPGHGGSEAAGSTLDQLVDTTATALRALAVGPVRLVGHSLGAMIAAKIASRGRGRARPPAAAGACRARQGDRRRVHRWHDRRRQHCRPGRRDWPSSTAARCRPTICRSCWRVSSRAGPCCARSPTRSTRAARSAIPSFRPRARESAGDRNLRSQGPCHSLAARGAATGTRRGALREECRPHAALGGAQSGRGPAAGPVLGRQRGTFRTPQSFTQSVTPALGAAVGPFWWRVGMNIFYIIGVVVVVAVILGYLGLA